MAKPKVYFVVDNQTNAKLKFGAKLNVAFNTIDAMESIAARERKQLGIEFEAGRAELGHGFLTWFLINAGEHQYKLLMRPDYRGSIPIDISALKDATTITCTYTISNLDGAMADVGFEMRYSGEGLGRV
ncbi:MAG TPA: hypothetical protein VHW00_15520 [Thermoanaerobaculia bacterium]|nr:hypothetical protein [Thermoanaerobaculia bacterium]